MYDGNVIEFDQDGDVNVVKVGGLKINNAEVVTKSYTDTTFAAIGVEASVSQLSTTSTNHGQRITTIEGAGYATTSQLSLYATASSLGTTNDTVGGINTRVNTLENSGFVTSAGLGGYNYATQGYVATAVDILNNTNIGASATSGTTAGVSVVNKASGTGVDFNFTIPPGATGVTPTIAVTTTQGTAGGDASVSASTSGSTTTLAFTIPPGETGATGTGGLNSSGVLDISKDGEVAKFQPATSGSYTLVNFNSKANAGSDKGFILVQDESAQSPGTSTEDLRMTIGVHNDFLQSTAYSDELWFQGGGRLCYNVGSWDSELNTIIGTPGAGTSHGGVKHEWRINNSAKMTLNNSGNLGIGKTPSEKLDVEGRIRANANGGSLQLVGTDHTYIEYYPDGTSSGRKAYVGYAGGSDNTFTISNSAGSGYVNFNGGNVGIGTGSPGYKLEVNGTSLFNGEMRWGLGITSHAGYSTNKDWYIRSGNSAGKVIIQDTGGNVGIGTQNPAQKLDVAGNITASGGIASGGTVTAPGLNITGLATWSASGYTSYANEGTNKNWYIRSGSANGNVILQDTGGRVGIGIANPTSTLDVNGMLVVSTGGCRIYGTELANYNYAPSANDYFTNGGSIQGDSPTLNFGLYVSNTIRVQGIVVFSDRRIKSNVVDIHDTTALEQIRLLKPKYYEYKDKLNRGGSSVIGFIAQDVNEVLPRAVSVADGEIPNIYEMATISSNNTVTFTNFNTSNLEGTNCTLIGYLAEDKREALTITEVVDEHTVRVEEDLSEWGEQLFVWGQKVQDFHHLNKDYIFTVATAALQEVDRQLQAERSRNDSLEARILALESVVGKL